jgi:hypothetical protein
MVTLDSVDRDRLGGPTFAWIGKHGERLRPRHGARRVRQVLERLGQIERRGRLTGASITSRRVMLTPRP